MVIASLVVAIIALLIAGASAAYTRKQATEATKVTAIEQNRRHDELTPQFKVTCEAQDAEGTHAELALELTGPAALSGLDAVTVRVRDDRPDRTPGFGSQLTQEQISEVIWGPYRIMPGLKDATTSSVAAIFYAEFPSVHAENLVEFSDAQLANRCRGGIEWVGPDEVVLGYGSSVTAALDNNGNAFVVALAGPSCASGNTLAQVDLVGPTYKTLTTNFGVLSPRVTV